MLLSVQSCTVSGWKAEKFTSDKSTFIGSAADEQDSSKDRVSFRDQQIIGDIIAKADKKDMDAQSLDWANDNTGSRGVISALSETKEHGKTCRTFQTTRETFDGIMMFEGKTCKTADNSWKMADFKAL